MHAPSPQSLSLSKLDATVTNQTCHNLTQTCHNLTRTCHNLTPNAQEDKWTFLLAGERLGVPVTPFDRTRESIVCKNKNIEGGMGTNKKSVP